MGVSDRMNMKKAAFTVYRNDPFLKKWLEHYKAFGHLYILNNNPHGEFVDTFGYKAEVINIPKEETDFVWLRGKVEQFMEDLLEVYDKVLFSTCDELIVSRKGWAFRGDFVRCTGYEIVGDKWARHKYFDKPLITKIPLKYEQGWHCLFNENMENNQGDPNFVLLHLKRQDPKEYLRRHGSMDAYHDFDDKLEEIPEEFKKYV